MNYLVYIRSKDGLILKVKGWYQTEAEAKEDALKVYDPETEIIQVLFYEN